MTEKRKPAYDLGAFKTAFSHVKALNITKTARYSITQLRFELPDVVDVIQTMRHEHFYKSMTAYSDYRIWQDVYHVPSKAGVLYVKFTEHVLTEFILLSFKEKNDG